MVIWTGAVSYVVWIKAPLNSIGISDELLKPISMITGEQMPYRRIRAGSISCLLRHWYYHSLCLYSTPCPEYSSAIFTFAWTLMALPGANLWWLASKTDTIYPHEMGNWFPRICWTYKYFWLLWPRLPPPTQVSPNLTKHTDQSHNGKGK